jgi:predicted transcriptional regulator
MGTEHHLGRLQHAILRVLWREGEASVARVAELLAEEGTERALTTVATMLAKLEKKGVVAHRVEGRQFVYRAAVLESEVHRSMVSELVERVFDGDATALVTHLIDEKELDAADLERLRELIGERAAKRRGGGRRER